MTNSRHSLRDIIVRVIAGLIVAAVTGIIATINHYHPFLPQFWQFVSSLFTKTWRHLVSPIAVPHGVLYLLVILAAILISVILRRLKKPSHLSLYLEDDFEGVTWRWVYKQGQIDIERLHPFCPICDSLLVFRAQHPVCLYCHRCDRDWVIQTMPGTGRREDALTKIAIEIDRKIRDKSWRL